jgi:hypothetical protein
MGRAVTESRSHYRGVILVIRFIESDDFIGDPGIVIERGKKGLWYDIHLVLRFTWPKRRWVARDYERSFVFAKPMPWIRLTLMTVDLAPGNPMRWLLARFALHRGISYSDETREVSMVREHVNVTHIYKQTREESFATARELRQHEPD